MKKISIILLIMFLFNCGKKEEAPSKLWKITGTVYCDGIPTKNIKILVCYGLKLQTFIEPSWLSKEEYTIETNDEGKYHAERKKKVSDNGYIRHFKVQALNPFSERWTERDLCLGEIEYGVTITQDFYFTSEEN